MPDEYKDHHYVPQWYQKNFMLPFESELFYLDKNPETLTRNGFSYKKKYLYKQGSKKCFFEKDLYTTKIQGIKPKDIEKFFFGKIDEKGNEAVAYFEEFTHPSKYWGTCFQDLMIYMSTQKLRTPKGLEWLSREIRSKSKDAILMSMIELAKMHCALWTECVWLIADADNSETKFILSDHPVTVYNRECGPKSQSCREYNDPEIWLQGTHTIFPLSLNKVLILTNLSWVRNPYQSAKNVRPNPVLFRSAITKITDVQIMRHLSEEEVRQINFIIKTRANRYIAAAREEWLYPEKYISKKDWNIYGHGYLLMPDPRPIALGGEIYIGHADGTSSAYDEYGRKPWDSEYGKERKLKSEHKTLYWFKGEFAKLFGPFRRGRSMSFMQLDDEKDDDEYHKYHLSLQKKKHGK